MTAQRLVSLDIFRGLTIAFMVLVNTPGTGDAVYGPLKHAPWHGWTPTDVVFPSFVWIVGVAMTLTLGRKLAAGSQTRSQLFRIAAKRAAILFALGLLIYSWPWPNFETFRILGVLQRISIAFLCATGIYLWTGLRGQIAWTAALLGGYWALMQFAPVPGHGPGHWDAARNFSHYIDSILLGAHNYEHTKTWDPEGVVSTLPAIATCLFGVLAGHLLARQDWSIPRRAAMLMGSGAALIALAYALEPWIPINKNIWTSTFTLLMAGIDGILFGAIFWIADGLGMTRVFRPAIILGMNAIAVYMASELIDVTLWKTPISGTSLRVWIYQQWFAPLASPLNASLLYAVSFVALMFALAWWMDRRGWYLRV